MSFVMHRVYGRGGEGGELQTETSLLGLALYLLCIHIQRHFPVTKKHLYW